MSSSSVSDGLLKFATQYSFYSGYITFSFGVIALQYSTYFFYPVLFGFLPIIIASSFSMLAYHNVRHIVRRQLPIVRRKLDKQITAMVLMRVIAFVCLVLPYNAYRIYAINFPIPQSIPMAYAISRLLQAIFNSINLINYVSKSVGNDGNVGVAP
ncbi:unnamed protein product [Adineta steineri]|uniref:Uncharacterized protein n=1 Tax=Adineta steineri TaxID=433720 RepID=A0A819S4W7_9BILA|nr:unnamed protein product [Adineta steineri]